MCARLRSPWMPENRSRTCNGWTWISCRAWPTYWRALEPPGRLTWRVPGTIGEDSERPSTRSSGRRCRRGEQGARSGRSEADARRAVSLAILRRGSDAEGSDGRHGRPEGATSDPERGDGEG